MSVLLLAISVAITAPGTPSAAASHPVVAPAREELVARKAASTLGHAFDRAVANLILRLESPRGNPDAPLRVFDHAAALRVTRYGPGALPLNAFTSPVHHHRGRQIRVTRDAVVVAAGSDRSNQVLAIESPRPTLPPAPAASSARGDRLRLATRDGRAVLRGAGASQIPGAPIGIPGTSLAVMAVARGGALPAAASPEAASSAAPQLPATPEPTLAPAAPLEPTRAPRARRSPRPTPTPAAPASPPPAAIVTPSALPTFAPIPSPSPTATSEPVHLLRHRPLNTPDQVLAIAIALGGLGLLALGTLVGALRRRWRRQLAQAVARRAPETGLASYERADLVRLSGNVAGALPPLREAVSAAARANDRAYVVTSNQPAQLAEAARVAADLTEQAAGLKERLEQATSRLDGLTPAPSPRELSVRLTELALELALGVSQSDPRDAALSVATRLRELSSDLARQPERSNESSLLATLPYLKELATALHGRCAKLAQSLETQRTAGADPAPFQATSEAFERANLALNLLSDRVRALEARLPSPEETP